MLEVIFGILVVWLVLSIKSWVLMIIWNGILVGWLGLSLPYLGYWLGLLIAFLLSLIFD